MGMIRVALVSRVPKSYGLMATDIFTDSKAYEEVRLQGGGIAYFENFSQKEKYLYDMNGLETWKQVIVNQPKVIANVINSKKKNIDLFIFTKQIEIYFNIYNKTWN